MTDARAFARRYDVVIVGAGIAGAALACRLAPGGLSILVLEAGSPPPLPPVATSVGEVDARVSALSIASVRLLRETAAWGELPDGVASPYQHMHVWEQDGTGAIDFSATELDQPVLGHIVENRWVVAALLARLRAFDNVDLRHGERLVALDAGAEQTLSLASGAVLQAGLLVGADGARSAVRSLSGIDARLWHSGQRAVVATIRTAQAHRSTAWQCFLPSGPLALLPLQSLPGERCCSIVWSADDAVADALMALDDAAFMQRLGRASEYRLGEVLEVSPRQCFPLRPLHAASYVAPGLALLGDAAHVIHPLAGQGINLGLADVRVLAEELARAIERGRSLGDIDVLARYERRRRADNALMLRAMEGFRQLYGDERLLPRLLRNAGMSAVHRLAPLKREFMRHAMGVN
jgi:2-polyprenylphenol 6-hydroxylase